MSTTEQKLPPAKEPPVRERKKGSRVLPGRLRSMKKWRSSAFGILKVVGILFFLYTFLTSIGLMESAFKLFGEGKAQGLFALASNRFVGLFVGILTTALVQSSSFTTSLVVGLVGSNMLTIRFAIPIVMGANIGTSVTNMLVAHGHIARKDEFRRATEGAVVHDIFNILSVLVLFPLEMMFGLLEKAAVLATSFFGNAGGATFSSPLKSAIAPATRFFSHTVVSLISSSLVEAIILLALALVILFLSLFFLVKVLKSLVLSRVESFFSTFMFRNAGIAFVVGLLFTATVQSSSVTTSLIVPMAAAGILTLEQIFPYTLGANVGTTVTALLASLATISAGNMGGVTVAFAHTLFNFFGIFIFYPFRVIPIGLARVMGGRTAENRLVPLLYVAVVFFYVPGVCIYLSEYGLTLVGALLLLGLPTLVLLFSKFSRMLQNRNVGR